MAEKKEPFIAKEDRPEPKLDPDKPVSELRVRDLLAILGVNHPVLHKTHKDTPELLQASSFKQKDSIKIEKLEKHEKPEKVENLKHEKNEKLEKVEKSENPKHEKNEKIEKAENLKHEKVEKAEGFKEHPKIEKVEKIENLKVEHLKLEIPELPPTQFEPGDPAPDSGAAGVVQLVTKLTEKVDQLANQVSELQKRAGK